MSTRPARRAGLVVLVTLVVIVVSLRAVLSAPAARAAAGVLGAPRGSDYLALGDSISFGFRDGGTVPAPRYDDAGAFTGYPEDVASALGLVVANLACPGETAASMVAPGALSNGCEHAAPAGGPPGRGYRARFPLHVRYGGTQLAAAVTFLRSHPDTRLVSLMIGINDLMICRESTRDACASPAEFDPVLLEVKRNITDALATLRRAYAGTIVVVDYYSFDYRSRTDDQAAAALDTFINAAALPFRVVFANGYGAFRDASMFSGGDPCTAGLLDQLSGGGCGIHPSPAGQDVLAHAVEAAVSR